MSCIDRESPRWNLDAKMLQRRRTLFWELFGVDTYFVSVAWRCPRRCDWTFMVPESSHWSTSHTPLIIRGLPTSISRNFCRFTARSGIHLLVWIVFRVKGLELMISSVHYSKYKFVKEVGILKLRYPGINLFLDHDRGYRGNISYERTAVSNDPWIGHEDAWKDPCHARWDVSILGSIR